MTSASHPDQRLRSELLATCDDLANLDEKISSLDEINQIVPVLAARSPSLLAFSAVNHRIRPINQILCGFHTVGPRALGLGQGCFSSGIVNESALMANLGATTSAARVLGFTSPWLLAITTAQ